MTQARRLTIFCGHYGSGKTSIAVSYALHRRAQGENVVIGDLDIVNPYFRTSDSRKQLEQAGVELVCSQYAGSNLDIPALPKELYAAVSDGSRTAVLDVGGDDVGAVALGRFASLVKDTGNYEMLFVANFYRPLTRTAEETLGILREVEAASGLCCTGLVHNSNIGRETTAEDLLAAVPKIEELSSLSGLPVRMTTATEQTARELDGAIENLFIINAQSFGIA